ncbi:MAG: hypothetical protein ACRD2L_06315, partial [Terriglobia bacterium]
ELQDGNMLKPLKIFLRRLCDRIFFLSDRLGFHVLPKHFYTPIPDYKWLRNNLDLWAKPAPMSGVCWQPERQLAWLKSTCEPFYAEVAGRTDGRGFGPVESQVLHCFIRSRAPERIIEIGGGSSTAIYVRSSRAQSSRGTERVPDFHRTLSQELLYRSRTAMVLGLVRDIFPAAYGS